MHWSVEQVFCNIEICLNILQYFDLEEQLQLTRVCEQFHNIIQNFVWKKTIKELQLIEFEPDVIVVSNEVSYREQCVGTYADAMFTWGYNNCKIKDITDKIAINFKNNMDLKDFVYINRNNIDKLQLVQESSSRTQPFDFIWKYKFVNLTEIDLDGLNGLNRNVKDLTANCPNLKTLVLRNCYDNNTESILKDLNVISTMAALKELNKLVVYETYPSYNQNFIPFITRNLTQLNEIILNVNIEISSDFATEYSPKSLCKLINLGSFHITNRMPTDLILEKSLLNHFQHLQTLAITTEKWPLLINRNALETLTKSCPTLKNLLLQFCVFEDFVAIPSLESLTLINADGIKWQNLKTLLRQKNLKNFTSVFTRFSENFEYFDIESPLKYLHIETMEYDFRSDLKNLLEFNCRNLDKLNTFIWHDFTLWFEDEPIQLHFQLKHHFRNLKSLFIDMEVIDIEDIMEMKCLTNLAVTKNDGINIENLLNILKLPSLENFTLYNRDLECILEGSPDQLNTFKTNLLTVKIPLHIFKRCTHIWLKFLTENRKLHIFCYFYNENAIDSRFLINLIAHAQFPERIKSLKICGFIIDRNSMQTNIDNIITKIMFSRKFSKLFQQTMYLQL